jgi:hypothetical protein
MNHDYQLKVRRRDRKLFFVRFLKSSKKITHIIQLRPEVAAAVWQRYEKKQITIRKTSVKRAAFSQLIHS